MPPMTQTLGGYLRLVRESKQLKLREVEEASGVSNGYLSQLEHNKIAKPSPHILHKLSSVYSIPYEVLMEKAGYIVRSETQNAIVPGTAARGSRIPAAALENLTQEEEEALLDYLAYLRFRRKRD